MARDPPPPLLQVRFVCARDRPAYDRFTDPKEAGRLLMAHEAQWSGNEYYSGTEEKLYFNLALVIWALPLLEQATAAAGSTASGLPVAAGGGWVCPAPGLGAPAGGAGTCEP